MWIAGAYGASWARREAMKPVEVDDASYLLLDSIGERLCAAWHLAKVGTGLDMDYLTSAAGCVTFDEAWSRVKVLQAVGILHDDGTIDDTVLTYLRRRGAIRIGKVSEGDD
jgi:hypothetical protein